MSKFNSTTSHPLIPNANQYLCEKKYVSIHSEDRNIIKYPNSSDFEIELPQDYVNVQSIKLEEFYFPSKYDVFSNVNNNLYLSFKFVNLYNPNDNQATNDLDAQHYSLDNAIYSGLLANINKEYIIVIEQGCYTQIQMANELTNKFNEIVTTSLITFFNNNDEFKYALLTFNLYDNFKIVFNDVEQTLWFGNSADQFILTNESSIYKIETFNKHESFTDWGLPAYLGFTRHNAKSINFTQVPITESNNNYIFSEVDKNPRFYYNNISNVGDNVYWITSKRQESKVYYLQAPKKTNLNGHPYIYMEISGLNCIDETSPYNLSEFTTQTNGTNGIVNSSFAKIYISSSNISTTYNSQCLNDDNCPYKWFNPPADRIRKLKIKFRFHNGQIVNMSSFNFSFMLKFTVLNPQHERKTSITSLC